VILEKIEELLQEDDWNLWIFIYVIIIKRRRKYV
jgi:hypothetical protein